MYALRFKEGGKLVGFRVETNDGREYCVSASFILGPYESIWVTLDRKIAERVAVTNTEWYSAGFECPENEYVGKLEVVELTIL